MTLLYVDTETTGLYAGIHEVVELAYAVDDGPIVTLVLPHTGRLASSIAYEVNGYHERGLADAAKWARGDAISDFLAAARGATLVGANPAFDAGFLEARFGFQPWSYRLLDVEAYASGVFGWSIPRSLRDVRDELVARGFEMPSPDHTAACDVEVTRACLKSLMWLNGAEARTA